MITVEDELFGRLEFDGVWSRPYEIEIFNRKVNVVLIVQTFDDDPVSNNQRMTFLEFAGSQKSIIERVEVAALNYYLSKVEDYRACFDRDEVERKAPKTCDVFGFGELVELKQIKIMYTDEGRDREVGFVFDAVFDEQLGVGVLVSNGVVIDVDVQDIVLG
ncbi:hypothetical protein PUP68_09050 [Pseudomonas chlororaphis]|uniref:DUF6985 domain-containing protein n=1 Tax=Pseudomonas chlororaphis TaxID=587753 RepID=UPI002368E7E8|nr:hypothetical protein [Pseudomonas chlororaphis]WDG79713.1 hypothetical protein PUP77_03190 [Pseudomonas chlororaphis]WDG87235.1 hypothetical protein PUP68_09050 [Pseudomonas chlororaphis]